MNRKHRATLERLFARQVPSDVAWRDIEVLLRALGARLSEGSGSRLRVQLNGVVAVFHRPHPKPEAGRSLIRAVRQFLESAGVQP